MMSSSKPSFLATINVALAIFCCIHPLLPLQVSASSSNGDAVCNSSAMDCANLGNITYPFWGSPSCAASPSYVLSNCTSSSQAYWDSFSSAAQGVIGPPVVTSISANTSTWTSSIQLSWNTSLNNLGLCAPLFSSQNLSQYNIPSALNLTGFYDNNTLEFSPDNVYLLMNCTNNDSNVVEHLSSQNLEKEGSTGCVPYKGLCAGLANTPCIQWVPTPSTKEFMLQHVLDNLSCSHFTFGIAFTTDSGNTQWYSGSTKLIWKNTQCGKCQNASGACISDAPFPMKFNHCECRNTAFDFNTQTCKNSISYDDTHCDGRFPCSPGAKIGTVVVLSIVVLGIGLALDARYYGGKIRTRIKSGFFNFIKAIIPIAISVLKKTLRKLQTSNYGPKASLQSMDLEGLTERPIEYSYSSIASATKSFNSLVGEGGFGVVYKGTLPQASRNGGLDVQIAVKVLEVRTKHSKQQFLNEVITIGRIHHVNVVRLLGFCMQEDHEMLVYEYIENGSLDRWLFDKQEGEDQKQVLDWGQRYAIALGIARGLSYLHEECRHRTVHCDIKPQNILLDGEMCPKIADFGLARLMSRDESKVVTIAKGTPGYMAPEFWKGGESELSTKFDVYSYGMVLLELIGGQRNFRRGASTASSFPAAAFKAAMQGDLESILDARLGITKDTSEADEAQKLQWHQVRTAAFVALWCIQDHPESRPCMSEVVKYLEGGLAVSNCPPQPTIAISSTSFIPQRFLSSHRHIHDDVSRFASGR